jgi:hypothetical protein
MAALLLFGGSVFGQTNEEDPTAALDWAVRLSEVSKAAARSDQTERAGPHLPRSQIPVRNH